MDCDDILADADCDDENPLVLERSADEDCDGALTAADCDDSDPNVKAFADDVDCDGVVNDDDTCPQQFNPDQIDPDRDGFGQECGDDESDFFVFVKPDGTQGTDGPQYRDCIIDEVCITRDYNSAPYNFGTAPVYSAYGNSARVMDPTHQDLTFDPYVTFSGPAPFVYDMEYIKNHLVSLRMDGSEDLIGADGGIITTPPAYDHYDLMFYQWNPGYVIEQQEFGDIESNAALDINKGGMAYGRAKAIQFSKGAYLDYTLPDNQDCITPSVCLARGKYAIVLQYQP